MRSGHTLAVSIGLWLNSENMHGYQATRQPAIASYTQSRLKPNNELQTPLNYHYTQYFSILHGNT